MDAISLLSKLLQIKAGSFGYAGTKDRRAVTTQQVSVYRARAEQLQDLNATLRNMCLGNFKYCKEPLKLGSLSGNHFVVTLRNVTGDHDKIEESLESLKVSGFINYFGLQRFGTTSVPTHKIGVFFGLIINKSFLLLTVKSALPLPLDNVFDYFLTSF